jgi:hypothetical protein
VERSYSRVPRAIFLIMVNVQTTAVMQKSSVFTELAVRGALAKLVLRKLGSLRIFATPETRAT